MKSYLKNRIIDLKRLLPFCVFAVMVFTVFTPSSLFLENINEFRFNYNYIFPIILAASIILLLIINIAALLLGSLNDKLFTYYIAVIFAFTLSAYIQKNFLNPNFPSLNGVEINWSAYTKEGLISAAFWLLCLLAVLFLAIRYKGIAERIMGYISIFLSIVQLITLVILLFTFSYPTELNYGFSNDGIYTLGADENIVVFVTDTLDASALEDYIASPACPEGRFDDFTFFDNAVSGGAPTYLGLRMILTGQEFAPMQSYSDYAKEIWEEPSLYEYLKEEGWDVRFFTDISMSYIKQGLISNYGVSRNTYIDDYSHFSDMFYKLSNFCLAPQFLKKYFVISTNDITSYIKTSDKCYKIDDPEFFAGLKAAGEFETPYKKAFRLYHLLGAHTPYCMNENLEAVALNSVTEDVQIQGVINGIVMYLDEMKKLGIYDKSTIIIMGDHGRHEVYNTESNPAFLIKLPGESHKLERNSAPVHYRQFPATLASIVMDDYSEYGPSFYDITPKSDVERLHTLDYTIRYGNRILEDLNLTDYYIRLIVPYDTDAFSQYRLWKPNEINRIDYTLGDIIDFTDDDNEYASKLNYRLYKENGCATASNELIVCFNLQDYNQSALDFHFTYQKIYNDRQNIKIYANEERIDKITCTSDNAGIDNILTIPKAAIKDNELIIRMVFPNAVTPNQLDRTNDDTRILSVGFTSMRLEAR